MIQNTVQQVQATIEHPHAPRARPHLIFSTNLDGADLWHLMNEHELFDWFNPQIYGLSMAMADLSDERAEVIRQLNARSVHLVARLLLPASEGFWFNVQNYPQAVERYRAVRQWAQSQHLFFDAIGLDIRPPASEVADIQRWGFRDITRRVRLAQENVLYPAARAAYTDLLAEIHHNGYEVHIYQLPLIADDRRAGTTLIQRAFDIVDLPADVEVLRCPSTFALATHQYDLGGSLIASYGPAADSIGVGHVSSSAIHNTAQPIPVSLSWQALERDILLATRDTDIVYISSLEGCVEQGLLERIADLDWEGEAHAHRAWRVFVVLFRSLILVTLLFARFGRSMLAWLGWILAALLFFRQVQRWWRKRTRHLTRDEHA